MKRTMQSEPKNLGEEFEVGGEVSFTDSSGKLHVYKLKSIIGKGAFGSVWRVSEISSGDHFALKVVDGEREGSVGGGLADFRLEQRIWRSLDSSAWVPKLIFTFTWKNRFFFLSELCRAETLHTIALKLKNEDDVAWVAFNVGRGVEELHRRGVIHCDLKPANVLFDVDLRPKITDFGIAGRISLGRDTCTQFRKGTPAFMAPELAESKSGVVNLSTKADCFAFGKLLFRLLHPQTSFEALRPSFQNSHFQFERLIFELTQPDPLDRPSMAATLSSPAFTCLSPEFLKGPAPETFSRLFLSPFPPKPESSQQIPGNSKSLNQTCNKSQASEPCKTSEIVEVEEHAGIFLVRLFDESIVCIGKSSSATISPDSSAIQLFANGSATLHSSSKLPRTDFLVSALKGAVARLGLLDAEFHFAEPEESSAGFACAPKAHGFFLPDSQEAVIVTAEGLRIELAGRGL